MIKTVIFDLQGVVIKTYRDREYIEYLGKASGKQPEYFGSKFFVKPWIDLESGRITQEKFELTVGKRSELTSNEMAWVEFYRSRLTPNNEIIKIIKKLKEHYRTAVLSNMDVGRYKATLKVLDMNLFEYRFISCYTGFRKPAKEAYLKALKKMKTTPEEAIFIDNDIENVDEAKRLGINSIIFKGAKRLEEQFSRMGFRV